MEDSIINKEETGQRPLRRPRHSTTSYARQYSEVSQEWRQRREKLLRLSRETYLTKGKEIAREFQQLIHDDIDDAYKVIYLIYEKAVKDIYSYPIAALFFEDLGQQHDNMFDSEKVCMALQKELQKSLTSLNNKFTGMEELEGTDVGIVYLLYLLLKLENLRKCDGSFFNDLLAKLFQSFYPYALNASSLLKKGLGDSVVGAICLLFQVAFADGISLKDELKIEQTLTFLRHCYVHSSIKATGRMQILYTLEDFHTRRHRIEFKSKNFYIEQYALNCKKRQYLIDSLGSVFCNLRAPSGSLSTSSERLNCSADSDVFTNSSKEDLECENGVGADSKGLKDSSSNSDKSNSNVIRNGHAENNNNGRSHRGFDASGSENEKAEVSALQCDASKKGPSSTNPELQSFIQKAEGKEASEAEITETFKVPAECIQRILGYEGAIHQKLEFQSNAKIDVEDDMMGGCGLSRPETTSVTAHRLVAGALGVSAKMDKEKLNQEKEKLATARELAMRYKMTTKQKDVRITGSLEAVSTAKKLIDEIVNYTTYLRVELPGFNIDQVVDAAGAKLETIETLLNVIFKLEEQEDGTVILHISGDKKSCEDARKLVIEELGRLKFAPGLLVRIPKSIATVLTTKDHVSSFACKMMELCESRVRLLQYENEFCFFLHGNSIKTYRAEDLLNKINTELVFNRKHVQEYFKSDYDDVAREAEFSLKLKDLFILMEKVHRGEPCQASKSTSDETLQVTKRKTYSREFLIQCQSSPIAKEIPLELKRIQDEKDEIYPFIITMVSPFSRKSSTEDHESSRRLSGAS